MTNSGSDLTPVPVVDQISLVSRRRCQLTTWRGISSAAEKWIFMIMN